MAKEQKVLTYSESISAVASLVLLAMTNQLSQPAVGGGDSLVAKSCLTLCNPMDCSLPGSSLSMGFPRQGCWCGLPFPSPGHLPKLGDELKSPVWAGGFFTTEPPGKPTSCRQIHRFAI